MTERQFSRTITVLPVHDIVHSSEWYGKVLGLETVYLHTGVHEGEATNYAVMVRDGVYVHLILDEPPPHDAAWTKAGTGYLYLRVRDVDQMFREIVAKGIEIARGFGRDLGCEGFQPDRPER
jgi:uncharacterized glyoxalase superfamily protein PhnB